MPSAKDVRVAPIASHEARSLVKRLHYSGKVVNNSQLHLGAFLGDRCLGVMSFGPPLDKRKALPLVRGTPWNGMLELNRLAFAEELPRNSESRCLAVAFRLIRRHYGHVQWILSFADATQCGDGTIYRAAGFWLIGIKKNTTIVVRPDGSAGSEFTGGQHTGGSPMPGYQIRYLYSLDPTVRERLTVPILPYSAIAERGASMYRGKSSVGSIVADASAFQAGEGGSTPTPTLQDELAK